MALIDGFNNIILAFGSGQLLGDIATALSVRSYGIVEASAAEAMHVATEWPD